MNNEDRLAILTAARTLGFDYAEDGKLTCTLDQLVEFSASVAATRDVMLHALQDIAAKRWDDNADLDDICTIAETTVALVLSEHYTGKECPGDDDRWRVVENKYSFTVECGRPRPHITIVYGDGPMSITNYGTKDQAKADAETIAKALNARDMPAAAPVTMRDVGGQSQPQYLANCLRAGACHGQCESTACTNYGRR